MNPSDARRSRAGFPRRAAFTLIELLAVMAIILVLAGLILYVSRGVQYKAAFSRATTEIKYLSTAVDSYKADNGTIPQNVDTDALIPTQDVDPANSTSMKRYDAANEYLYACLAGVSPTGTTVLSKAYITLTPSQIASPTPAPVSGQVTNPDALRIIIDPFGLPYGYSTANLAQNQKSVGTATPSSSTPTPPGYNPDYDIWSTGGYSDTAGVKYPVGSTTSTYSNYWARNW